MADLPFLHLGSTIAGSILVRRGYLFRFALLLISAMTLDQARPALAAATTLVPGHACERTYVRRLPLASGTRPETLVVRATGPSCARAKIVVTVRGPSGAALWSEWVYLSEVEFGQPPAEVAQEITFERVIGMVENWVSVENTSEAPAWVDGIYGRAKLPTSGATQYDSKLDRIPYQAIRAAHERMLCMSTGPESAHCIAVDPTTRRLVEFFSRGI